MIARTVATIALCLGGVAIAQGEPVKMSDDVLAGLVEGHPRLVLTDARLQQLQQLARTDELLRKAVGDVIARADKLLKAAPIAHKLDGPRLLGVSRDMVDRVYTLGLAWRWTGQARYADNLRDNLLRAAAFKDWNPSHFLDTAEMSHALGVGYDWLHDRLTAAERKALIAGLIRNGLEPGLAAYGLKKVPGVPKQWWVESAFNWNQVCNMGLSIGALAIADVEPSYARQILPQAVKSLPVALESYDPDGAWAEGPGYWYYATRYTVWGLAAMQTALGRDFGLSDRRGLREAGAFPLHGSGPTGLYFNFADAGFGSARRNLPPLLWLAGRYDQPALAEAERQVILKRPAEAMDVIWYIPAGEKPAAAPLDRVFRGKVETAFFRSDWRSADALYLAVKAGYNQVNHGQLDLGTFVLDALGQRWALDLGSDYYNLPGYWDGHRRDGKRWTYYRLGSLSHNVPLLDGANQDPMATSRFLAHQVGGDSPWVTIDLTEAYAPKAARAIRGVQVLQRRSVLIQDEIDLKQAVDVTWGLTTAAEIAADGATATLTLNGRSLKAMILSPQGASFRVASAEQKPPEAVNKGIRRLEIHLDGAKGTVRLGVLLAPQWPNGPTVESVELRPLGQWKVAGD